MFHFLHVNIILGYVIAFPLTVVSALVSIIWNVYFVGMIVQFFRSYRHCVEEAKSDPFGNLSEKAFHHKSEFIKYVFLLLMNVTEVGCLSLYLLGDSLAEIPNAYRLTDSNCTKMLTQFLNLQIKLMYENPINSVLISIGQSLSLISVAFGICLMKFLHEKFHNIRSTAFHSIRRLLVVTCLLEVLLITTGSVPQLMIINIAIVPILSFIYFLVWVKHTRMFYRTLRWRSVELRIRSNNERLVRRSVISCYQFFVIMWCFGLAILCLNLCEFLASVFTLLIIALQNGPCLFNHIYGTAYYKPVLVTEQEIEAFRLAYDFKDSVSFILESVAVFLLGSQYLLCTAVFFGRILMNELKYRYGYVQTRFTPSLTQRFLFK